MDKPYDLSKGESKMLHCEEHRTCIVVHETLKCPLCAESDRFEQLVERFEQLADTHDSLLWTFEEAKEEIAALKEELRARENAKPEKEQK